MEHMAATQAAEDDAWLLLACSPDEWLTVSVIHNEQFPFPLKASSSLKIRSKNVPAVSVEGKSIKNDQVLVDPKTMRHIMPLLLQDYYLVVSIPERDGAMHDYTFSTQPNDLALAPIRSHCFDSLRGQHLPTCYRKGLLYLAAARIIGGTVCTAFRDTATRGSE
jgi:hypothetical protein